MEENNEKKEKKINEDDLISMSQIVNGEYLETIGYFSSYEDEEKREEELEKMKENNNKKHR